MNRYYSILLFFLLLLGCDHSSQTEKDYIKNLEEKNKILETELKELKSKSKPTSNPSRSQKETNIPKDYFTIGSTEDDVLEVMGNPTRFVDLESFGKRFYYGESIVIFAKGKVNTYHNFEGNLKVKVKD